MSSLHLLVIVQTDLCNTHFHEMIMNRLAIHNPDLHTLLCLSHSHIMMSHIFILHRLLIKDAHVCSLNSLVHHHRYQ